MKDGTFTADRLLALYDRVAEAEDAIPRLRRFVLDLAVRGKLVEQDLSDEPATELLKRIAKEKARLVKAGEIRKPKPFDPIDEPPFAVPANWAWSRMREVTADRGQMIPNTRFTYIDVSAINKEAGVIEAPTVLEPAEAPSRARKIVRKGDVIYSCVRPYLLNVAVVEDEIEPAPIASTAFAIINGLGLILPRYIWIVLRSPFMVAAVEETQRGQAYPAINDSDFAVLPFPLPPLAEQHRIVAKVDELMALCDRLEGARTGREAVRDLLTAATLARLTAPETDAETFPTHARFALQTLPTLTTREGQIKTLRQTILNLAVRGKLVEQDPTDEPAVDYVFGLNELPAKARKQLKPLDPEDCGGLLPSGWAWLPLGSIIGNMDAGWSPQCENHPRFFESEWGILKTTAVQALSFDSAQHKLLPQKLRPRPEYQAEVGDILVTRAGPKNRVGVSCVVDVPCPRLMISDKLIRFHAAGELSPLYLALTLNAGYTFERMEAAKSGMAVMQMNISQEKLRAIPIPLPPLAEQHRIVAKVDALMALCDQLESSLTTATTTRSRLLEALLHEALGGAPGDQAEVAA